MAKEPVLTRKAINITMKFMKMDSVENIKNGVFLQSALTMEEHKREAQRLENDQGKYINGKNACFNSYATYGSSSHALYSIKW